jgi:hypothetical protein
MIILKRKDTNEIVHQADVSTVKEFLQTRRNKIHNLSYVDFSNINLSGCDFSNMLIKNADFKNAKLIEANFTCTIVRGSDFFEANLSGANLSHGDFRDVNLRNACLHNTNMFNVNLYHAKLKNTLFPSPTIMLTANWKNISDSSALDLLRYNAFNHPQPERFFLWKEFGVNPYTGLNIQHAANFLERPNLIKDDFLTISVKSAYSLMNMLLKECCDLN